MQRVNTFKGVGGKLLTVNGIRWNRLFNIVMIAVNDFAAEKSARFIWVFVITELVVSECSL